MTEERNDGLESSENGTELYPDDIGSIEEIPKDTILSRQTSVNLVPFIGQRFVSQDAAYEFYCSFAKQCGFSIRRHRTRGKDGVGRGVTRRDFTCHRSGYPQMKQADEGKLQRNRKSSRCGCQAYMRIVNRADFNVPEWRVTGFSNNHNHELLKSDEAYLLPAHCSISSDDKSRICMFAKAGMSVRQMLRLMELEKGVKLGCLPFTEIDVRNLLQSFRRVDRDSDAIDLISTCKKLKDENYNFKYDYKLDGYNRLDHIAWSYSSCLQQYTSYGDAVVFDTTHRLDAHDMLLGLWVGVDSHGSTCLFGCVLLRDENAESFAWALKTFLNFMKGKAPQTIITDQNVWLKDAIASELPKTKHAFCVWHIMAKFSEWFSLLLGSHYDTWKAEFYRLYSLEIIEDFENGWREMMARFGLQSNKHIISLYALRSFWALSFLRRHFFGGLVNKCQLESIHAFTQRILSVQSQLDQFIHKVADIAEYNDQAGAKLNAQLKLQKISLKTGSPIESHAATIFTPYAFCLLQEQLLLAPQFASVQVDEGCFHVRHHSHMDAGHEVYWDPHRELIRCSCHQFEFHGILCRHVLRVLSSNNCFQIPKKYIPVRWRLSSLKHIQPISTVGNIGKVQLLESLISTIITESVESEERLHIACDKVSTALSHIKQLPRSGDHTHEISYNSASGSLISPEVEDSDCIVQSFTVDNLQDPLSVGRLKERRSSGGCEASKKRRRFSLPCCGQFGHDASGCPLIQEANLSQGGDALGFL
ncbi:hypothetical protein V2J09_006486 [Rumex salicifolius]